MPINAAAKPAVHQKSRDCQTSRQMLRSGWDSDKGHSIFSMKRLEAEGN